MEPSYSEATFGMVKSQLWLDNNVTCGVVTGHV